MKSLYFFILLSCFSGAVLSQSMQERKCAAQLLHQQKMENNPSYKLNYEEIQRRTKNFQIKQQSSRSEPSTIVREIPVYVHLIYDESVPAQNLSNAQIESQIAVLNEDFRALNADVSEVPDEFSGVVSDYQLTFTLENVFRKSSAETEWDTDDSMKSSASGGLDAVTPETHLNIWVCNLSGSTLGYAQFPGDDLATDGVVIGSAFFGSSDYDTNNDFFLASAFDKGRTATHEIGHYLNLRHIWGDGACSVDDFVEDTPIQGKFNEGCPSYPSKSCSQNTDYTSDMFMNYMDYVNDACMFMFTEGQKTRSYALFEPGGFRENLGQVLDDCDLPAPDGLRLAAKSVNSISLAWNAVADAESYEVWVDGSVSSTGTTSITVNDLASGSLLEVQVIAKCANGGSGLYSEILNVSTLGCYQAPIQFTINTDEYASETSWALSFNGTVVQINSIAYSNNSTYTETFDFGDGIYNFEIFDSESDGICCGYGTGSYTLTDSEGRVIKSGGEFNSSEKSGFCVEADNPIDCNTAITAVEGDNTTEATTAIYEFEATVDKQYVISSVGTTTVDTDLYIYSNCDSLLAQSDNFEDLQSEATVALLAGEKIYIVWKNTHTTDGFDWKIFQGADHPCSTFEITEVLVSEVSCFGSADGTIEVVATGGRPPFSYTLDGGDATEDNIFEGLSAGEYSLTVTDLNNCQLSTNITIKTPATIEVDADVQSSTSIDGNGSIDLTVKGGSGNYTYLWSNGVASASLQNLEVGMYSVEVVDENGCVIEESFEVGGVTSNDLENEQAFLIYPNPVSSTINLEHSGKSERVIIYDTRGTIVLREDIYSNSVELDVSSLSPGIYFIRLNKEAQIQKIIKD